MDWIVFLQIVLLAILGAMLISFILDSVIRTTLTVRAAVNAGLEGGEQEQGGSPVQQHRTGRLAEETAMATHTRRTIAKGAAWTVPIIAIGAAAPAMAASPPDDPCQLVILPGSFKCCANGPDKTMYLELQLGYSGICNEGEPVCVTDVLLSNGQPIGVKTINGQPLSQGCVLVTPGDTFTVLLQQVHSCAANLVFIDAEGNSRIVKSGNIPGGDETECVTRSGG